MKFSVVVHSAPYSSQGPLTALKFCKALLADGNELYRVFFFRDGVRNGDLLAVIPQDDINLQEQWQEFLRLNRVEATVCVSSALKRGILDQQEASRYEKSGANLSPLIEIAGLGQLVDACQQSDRVINFG